MPFISVSRITSKKKQDNFIITIFYVICHYPLAGYEPKLTLPERWQWRSNSATAALATYRSDSIVCLHFAFQSFMMIRTQRVWFNFQTIFDPQNHFVRTSSQWQTIFYLPERRHHVRSYSDVNHLRSSEAVAACPLVFRWKSQSLFRATALRLSVHHVETNKTPSQNAQLTHNS